MENNYDEPSIDRMRAMLTRAVVARAKLREAKLLLAMYQAEMDKRKSRTPYVRMIGLDDDSRAELKQLHWGVKECEDAVDAVEADIEVETFVKDIARMRYYRERAF